MTLDADDLERLHAVWLPDVRIAREWPARLAALLEEHGADPVQLLRYFDAVREHAAGILKPNADVASAFSESFRSIAASAGDIALLVDTRDAAEGLDAFAGLYAQLRMPVVFAVGGTTSEFVRARLRQQNAKVFELEGRLDAGATSELSRALGTRWLLRLHAHELPTPGLIMFAAEASRCSEKCTWGFSRLRCRYDGVRRELQYSSFAAFGPLAHVDRQWRLSSVDDGPKEMRCAPSDALFLDFDWVVRSSAQRVRQLTGATPNYDPPPVPALSLCEAIPDCWHMFHRVPDDEMQRIGRAIRRIAAEQSREVVTPQWRRAPLAWLFPRRAASRTSEDTRERA